MKVLLYSEGKNMFNKSGVGKALEHQKQALLHNGVDFTLNEKEFYDIAHINTIGTGASKTLRKSKKKKKPVIYHTHTTFEDFRNSFMFSNFFSHFIKKRILKLYSAADYLIFPSEYTKNVIRSYGITNYGEVISNGVNTEVFRSNRELSQKFIDEYKIDKPVVICVGLPFKRKGIIDFCKTAERLPQFQFMWFGAKITSVLPKEIKNLIENPPSNVIFPGFVPQDILLGAYSAAELFFFPSYEENEGIAVLEALSMECPVLLRDIPVYEGWMKDGVNCYKAKTNEEFEDIIKNIFSKNFNEVIKNGRKTAEERDLKIIGSKLKKVYEKLI